MYRYYIGPAFKKMLKPYLKKHRTLLDDIMVSLRSFDKRLCASLGARLYKMRVTSSVLSRGKSGAFRMIILVLEINEVIAPLVFYSKHDRASISKQEIINHAKLVIVEINQAMAEKSSVKRYEKI